MVETANNAEIDIAIAQFVSKRVRGFIGVLLSDRALFKNTGEVQKRNYTCDAPLHLRVSMMTGAAANVNARFAGSCQSLDRDRNS